MTELYRWDSQLFDTNDGASGPQYFISNKTVAVSIQAYCIDGYGCYMYGICTNGVLV